MAHSPEPWRYGVVNGLGAGSCDVVSGRDLVCATGVRPNAEADARRIVACVNALAGVPTEKLEYLESGPGRVLYYELHEPLPPMD
jgi:hypothetical protein